MIVTYNGITLRSVRTILFDSASEYSEDETSFLWRRVEMEFIFHVNPQATSYQTNLNPALNPTAPTEVAGEFPARTLKAILWALGQARQTLVVSSDAGRTLLVSPLPGFNVDARNGPTPRVVSVVQVGGERMWAVRWRCTTWINEGQTGEFVQGGDATGLKPLLSHRWTQGVDVDMDHFAVRVTEGTAVFRRDVLDLRSIQPDDLRRDLFQPIPAKFRRTVNVVQQPDGQTIRYRIEDREVAYDLGPNSSATRVEAYETGHWDTKGGAVIGLNVAWSTGTDIWALLFGRGNANADPARNFGNLVQIVRNQLPQFYRTVHVRAWGNRLTPRRRLLEVCLSVALTRLVFGNESVQHELQVTTELHGKMVEIVYTQRGGADTAILSAIVSPIAGGGDPDGSPWNMLGLAYRTVPEDDPNFNAALVGFPRCGLTMTNFVVGNPNLFADAGDNGNSRGTWGERLVAAVLLAPEATPTVPGNPGVPPLA